MCTPVSYENMFHDGMPFCQSMETKAEEFFREGKLFFFDPMTHTDICHLTAYRVASLALEQNFKKEYLVSSFLIHSASIRERKNITHLAHVLDEKRCNQFVSAKKTMEIAKGLVIKEMGSFLAESMEILLKRGDGPLVGEMANLLEGSSPEDPYPKFVGVLHLLKLLQSQPIPIILKVKVLDGTGFKVISFFVEQIADAPKPLLEEDRIRLLGRPFLVMEALASLHKPVGEFMQSRMSCCHSLFRVSSVQKHAEEEVCVHCHEGGECLEEAIHQVHHELTRLSFQDLLKAAGAAFTDECQRKGRVRVLQSGLKEEFERSLRFADEYGISRSSRPSCFMVEHMYADAALSALSLRRLVDTTPRELIAKEAL